MKISLFSNFLLLLFCCCFFVLFFVFLGGGGWGGGSFVFTWVFVWVFPQNSRRTIPAFVATDIPRETTASSTSYAPVNMAASAGEMLRRQTTWCASADLVSPSRFSRNELWSKQGQSANGANNQRDGPKFRGHFKLEPSSDCHHLSNFTPVVPEPAWRQPPQPAAGNSYSTVPMNTAPCKEVWPFQPFVRFLIGTQATTKTTTTTTTRANDAHEGPAL